MANFLLRKILAGLAIFFFVSSATAAPPLNDQFANRTILSGASVAVDGTTVDATLEAGEPSAIYMISSVWYE
jgi:hypothetical protein